MNRLLLLFIVCLFFSCENKQLKIKNKLAFYLDDFNLNAKVSSGEDSSLFAFDLSIEKPYRMADYGERDLFLSYLTYLLRKEYEFDSIKLTSFLDKESNFNRRVVDYSLNKIERLDLVFHSGFSPLVEYCMYNFEETDVFELDDMLLQVKEVLNDSVVDLTFYRLLKEFSSEKNHNGKASFTLFVVYRFLEDMIKNHSVTDDNLQNMKRMKSHVSELWELNKGREITKKDAEHFNKVFSEAIAR